MANYLHIHHFFIENSQLTLREPLTYSDFDSLLSNLKPNSYLDISSRHGRSAFLISNLLKLSENKSDLWFLTSTILNTDNPYKLMHFNNYENYICEINNLISWSKNNLDKICTFIEGGWDVEDIKKAIHAVNVFKDISDDDYLDHNFIFSYLTSVVQMLRDAISKQMSIVVCMWGMS
ncbi:MAG: hypothetical protein H7Z73_00485 [Candidatus Saccharibacteria bacterium]|nr:hypothetical protein [Moraxellaceae bacterium]